MHRAFYIEEILLCIFSSTDEYRWDSESERRLRRPTDLTALARTCKTFKEPALDKIWVRLDNLTPLVRCLPETTWVESEGVYSLRKPLEQNEWDVILGYARRVRHLDRLRGSTGLAASCIEVLSNPPGSITSIFPNLRIVELEGPSAAIIPLVRHLASPQLTEIWLCDADSLGAAVEAFGEGSPLVDEFRVMEWANATTTSNLICHWQNLSLVCCPKVGLNADAIAHLSCLRNLRDLSFKVHDAVVDQIFIRFPNSTLSFGARKIYLASGDLTTINRLLRHCRFPVNSVFEVFLENSPTNPALISFFTVLHEVYTDHNSLKGLCLWDGQVTNESNGRYITFDCLHPLTVFVNIEAITINVCCGVDLKEELFLCLASSWPKLEQFVVAGDCDWTPSSGLTPGGFLRLIERCKSLDSLAYMLDIRGYTEIPPGHPWRGLTMPPHLYINLLCTPIEEESVEALGVFFHLFRPEPSIYTNWDNPGFEGTRVSQELYDMYSDRWKRVRSLAYNHWKARRELRHSLESRSSSCD